MKEIKTIYRPQAEDYKNRALLAGFKEYQFASYIKFLSDFHSGDEIRKIYLK